MMDAVQLPAVVMAAGSSSRMGQPKQLLRFGELTMLEMVLSVLDASRVDQVIVVLGSHADDIKAQVELGGARAVFNPDYKRGSATSLRAGLAALESPGGVMVVAGDQPAITAEIIDGLAAAFLEENAWAAVCDYTDGPGHPWLLSQDALEAMPALEGDKVLWRMLSEDSRVLRVKVDRPKPRDVNTWQDYETACHDLGLTPTSD